MERTSICTVKEFKKILKGFGEEDHIWLYGENADIKIRCENKESDNYGDSLSIFEVI